MPGAQLALVSVTVRDVPAPEKLAAVPMLDAPP